MNKSRPPAGVEPKGPSAAERGRGTLILLEGLLLGDDQLVILHSQLGGVAGLEGAVQHLLGHSVLHLALDTTR